MTFPFVSQLVSGSGGNRCGGACLTSVLAGYGRVPATQETMLAIAHEEHIADGTADGTYTSFAAAIKVAAKHGVVAEVVTDWRPIYDALDGGAGAMLLVDNSRLRPTRYPDTPGWFAHHLILLTGYDSHVFHANDPLAYPDLSSSDYTVPSVIAGTAAVGGVQAVVFQKQADVPEAPPALAQETTDVSTAEDTARIAELIAERDTLVSDRSALVDQVAALHAEVTELRDVVIPALEAAVGDPNITAARLAELKAAIAHLAELATAA